MRSPPATVFIDMRFKLDKMVHIVQDELLPALQAPVVVFTTGHDRTIPLQLDARFPPTRNHTLEIFSDLLDQRLVDRWVTENLDDAAFHRKLVAVPTGFYTKKCVFQGQSDVDCSLMYWPVIRADWIVPLSRRPLTVSCNGNLERQFGASSGGARQFGARTAALENCRPGSPWSGFSEHRGHMDTEEFPLWWQNHSFVICAHGGGLDPSPRAFMAIAAGAIPIVQRSALDAVYSQLPVAFVDDWGAASISLDKLRRWRAQLAPHYEEPELVARVVAKLTMQHWWRTSLEGTAAADRGA
ncbi:unnamed protein product [Prorocentrum cordatum]|uniref:Exostosin GT47 domain-containing protein n=1 Tax=Prorocentrum cordatum TaxID=2364126 RepID=A0ABN9Y8M0_9DINO|nr:unnamed protein product [Polarella glacialis]